MFRRPARRLPPLLVLLLLPPLLSGCLDSDAVDCGPGPPVLELGAGAQGFLPLAEGGRVYVVCGPQGGRHVFLRLRASGLAPNFDLTARVGAAADDRQIAYVHVKDAKFRQDGDRCVSSLYLVFVEPPTSTIDGVPARLRVLVTDSTGQHAEAERSVVVDGSMVNCGQ